MNSAITSCVFSSLPDTINLNTSLNNVTVALNTPVDLTALPMTLNGGTVGSIAWSEVNTTTTNVWVEVDIAA